ncbi:hypothetical protein Tco_0600848 [Tanacetum coccineum]
MDYASVMDIDDDTLKISSCQDSILGQLLHIPVGAMLKEDMFNHHRVPSDTNNGLHPVALTPYMFTNFLNLVAATNSDIEHLESQPETVA